MILSGQEQAMNVIAEAKDMNPKLVLIVGEAGKGKTALLRNLASQHGVNLININLYLSKELLTVSSQFRPLKVPEILSDLPGINNEIIFLDNLEILFDVNLCLNPLQLLRSLSTNRIVVASWIGNIVNNKLIYATPGHSEYKSYDIDNQSIIHLI